VLIITPRELTTIWPVLASAGCEGSSAIKIDMTTSVHTAIAATIITSSTNFSCRSALRDSVSSLSSPVSMPVSMQGRTLST
jgi:hypothetical protein